MTRPITCDLAAVRALFQRPEETGEETPTCAACHQSVHVEDTDVWEDGDLCSGCTYKRVDALEVAGGDLLEEVERLRGELILAEGELAVLTGGAR